MKANLAAKEPQILAAWDESDLYGKIRQQACGKPIYTLHDGPPYANGNIHIGHALNKILKDIIVKAKTMQGFDSLYVPGWDCHGLPIEHQLFKELKKRKSEVNTSDFRKKAAEYAMKYVGIQKEQFQRLGVFGEWDHPYLTLSAEYEYWILNAFARLVEGGYIYRGLKPVNWCSQCETALAEAEVEYEDHTSPSVYVKFKVNNPGQIAGLSTEKPLLLLVWTTTPWTLLANVAVAVHTAYRYVVMDLGNEWLVVEESLSRSVMEKSGIKELRVLKTLSGKDLGALVYTHPFGLKDNCRVINVDYVTKEEGTGLVHTAPGHGQEDYEAGLAHDLEILMPVDDRGIFTEEAGKFAGQHVFKANEEIIKDLNERGMLFAEEKISHSYPHCWRCKKPIIFRATYQWFLQVDHKGLRGRLKNIIQNAVRWIPSAGRERIMAMITLRPDWCLSRQRHWGVPIPALACGGCKDEHKLFPEVVHHFADIVRREGTDVWFEKELKDLLPAGFRCPDCQGNDFTKTHDILDVWFDSGVSHQAVIQPMLKQSLPADLYLEGSDQHRGWFQSSLITAAALFDQAPFRAVLTHGFVVDGSGRKMSKSLGNVISPLDVIKTSGADILRLWAAASNYHEDIRLSKEIMDRVVDAYRKIRNTMRFLLGNLHGFDPEKNLMGYKELLEIDQWALGRLQGTVTAIEESYNAFEFAKVYKSIYAFCNEDLSGFYLDILKDRLYTSSTYSPERRSAQTVLYHILNYLVRLLAPVMPFTAEEVFLAMPKDGAGQNGPSVHLLTWRACPEEWRNDAIEEKFKLLIELRPFVLKALEDKRRDEVIGSSLDAKLIFQTASDRDYAYLKNLEKILSSIFIVSQVEVKKVTSVAGGLSETFSLTNAAIERAAGEKCVRCWNYSLQVGKDNEHPELCERCLPVVKKQLLNEDVPGS